MPLFQGKYRVETSRLVNWDYGSNAAYFVTICTNGMAPFFGKVDNGEMQLSDIGILAQSEWLKTPVIRPDMNLQLGEFVVMPNHFHGIIFIGENEYNSAPTPRVDITEHRAGLAKFGPQSKNLGAIVRGYKSAVTLQARLVNPGFKWQARFHDHIIRDKDAYFRIANYIINNPANWKQDKFYCL